MPINDSSRRGRRGVDDDKMPPSSSSDRKRSRDKEAAIDSLYPPSTAEICGHARYLSEEAARLAMEEVDERAVRCLGYSSNERAGGSPQEGGGTEGGKGAARNSPLPTLAGEIRGYLEMFQPDDEDNDEGGEDAATATAIVTAAVGDCLESEETDHAESAARRRDAPTYGLLPARYDPTLLPMITIKCRPNALDRAEMTRVLSSDLMMSGMRGGRPREGGRGASSSEGGMRPYVCAVRSRSELVRQGHVTTEVLSQCITNDPDGEAFAAELQRGRKRRKSSGARRGADDGVLARSVWDWTRSLVDWAGHTEAFDSIIVILEVSPR